MCNALSWIRSCVGIAYREMIQIYATAGFKAQFQAGSSRLRCPKLFVIAHLLLPALLRSYARHRWLLSLLERKNSVCLMTQAE